MAVPVERGDHVCHRLEVRLVGRARCFLDRLEAERLRVLPERGDVLIGICPQVLPCLLRAEDRAVVHVGEVHHLLHFVALEVLQRPAQHVEADEGAEVADVAPGVDGEPAGVHPDRVVAARREILLAASQGVEETHDLGESSCGPPLRSAIVRDRDGQLAVVRLELHVAVAAAVFRAVGEGVAQLVADRRRSLRVVPRMAEDGRDDVGHHPLEMLVIRQVEGEEEVGRRHADGIL